MRPLEKFFDAYGQHVARHPWPYLVVPTLLTLLSCLGFLNFHAQNDIWDIYSPLDALSRTEEKALGPFEFASATHHYRLQILVDRKDGGNLLNKEDLTEIAVVNKLITENASVSDGSGHSFAYRELCGVYCNESNALVLGFLQAVVESGGDSSSFILTYPNAQALQNHVFLGYSIGGLHWTQRDALRVVERFDLFILHYMVDTSLPNGPILKNNFEHQLRALFDRVTAESPRLNYALLSRNRELEEQSQITLVSIPFLGLTGLVLTLFLIVTLFNIPFYKSQHVEAVFGVVSPGMALVTTFGGLWALGLPFSNILTVVPFLVITIGIDDAFLILAGWRHSSGQTDFESRMGAALAKSGASVSVTSITDILCFGVGLVSAMPVVQLFCLYTSVALTIDFFYQITFFTAVVSLCGRRQVAIEQALAEETHKHVPSITSQDSDGYLTKLKDLFLSTGVEKHCNSSNDLCQAKTSPTDQSEEAESTWLMAFVNFLHWRKVRVIILIFFVLHLATSVYLCTLVNTDFDMENLYLKQSPLTPISQKMQKFILNESFVVNFVLTDMGSFQDPLRREQFAAMLTELENIPRFSMGDNGSTVWLRDYELAASFWGTDDDSIWEPTEVLKNFHAFNLGDKYITTKRLASGDEVIDSFFFVITYHNMRNFLDVEDLLLQRRAILQRYASVFNVSSHHPLEKVPTESAASAPSNFISTAVSAVVLMSVLVLLFVLDIGAIFSVVLSILSISTGTVGYLHLCGVNLDAVSLISMLMSIGFSVDYSAHICYHYFTMTADDNRKRISIGQRFLNQLKPDTDSMSTYHRLEHTFNGVGWPVIQSGVSTVLGMVPLFFVDAYVVAVFWKTIILVTVLGLWHALFLLPVLFLAFNDLGRLCRSKRTVTEIPR